MAYSLTLSESERDAFDWVGHRYSSTGFDMASMIQEGMPEDKEWGDSKGDITFNIPEWAAWQMAELAQSEEHQWPCFSENLAQKMSAFVDAIV